MAGLDIKENNAEIISILENMPTDTNFDGFKQVFGYEFDIDEVEGDPLAIVRWNGVSIGVEFNTTHEDSRQYTFAIQVLLHVDENTSPQELEERMQITVGYTVQALQEEYVRANRWYNMTITTGNVFYRRGDYLIADIDVVTEKLVNIT